MGLSGLEPPTSRLSGVRSNRLSYKPALIFFWIRQPPILPYRCQYSTFGRFGLNRRVRDGNGCYPKTHRHRKNVLFLVRAEDHSLTATDLRRLLLGRALIPILTDVCISEQAHMHTSVKIPALTLTTRQ